MGRDDENLGARPYISRSHGIAADQIRPVIMTSPWLPRKTAGNVSPRSSKQQSDSGICLGATAGPPKGPTMLARLSRNKLDTRNRRVRIVADAAACADDAGTNSMPRDMGEMRHCGAALLMGSTESAGGGWGGESMATGANQVVLARRRRRIMTCHCRVQVAVGRVGTGNAPLSQCTIPEALHSAVILGR